MRRALLLTAVATAAATFCLVLLGSTVRVTESGMGCPDWPLCRGQIAPIDQFHALLEQSHRYLALVVSIGVVAVALLARRARSARRVVAPALAGVAIVGVQIVLGAITVLTHNAPVTVALHLLVGFLLLGVTTVTAASVMLDRRRPGQVAGSWGWLSWTALAVTLALFASGTGVVDSGAAKACPSWPGCPPGRNGWLVAAQLAHRGLAALAVAFLAALAYRAVRRGGPDRLPPTLGWALFGLLVAQVAAGATSAVLRAPPAAQDVHLGLAATIWVCAVTLAASGARAAAPASSRRQAAGTYGQLGSSPRGSPLEA